MHSLLTKVDAGTLGNVGTFSGQQYLAKLGPL